MNHYTLIEALERNIQSINNGVWRQNKDEEEGVNRNKNTTKNHNILPKNHSKMHL